jgi:beta-galactosidase/beta-glucuronidase
LHISNFSAFCDSVMYKEYPSVNCLNRMRNVKEKQNYFKKMDAFDKKNVTNHVLKGFQFLQRNNFVSKGD